MPDQSATTDATAAPAGFSVDDFKKFAALHKQKRELDAELRTVKDAIAAMQEPLLEQLTNSGMAKINLDGGALVYTKTDVTVKAGKPGESATEEDWNAACDVLESIGMGDFSKRRFLIPTLKSYIAGLISDADAKGHDYETVAELLPPELAQVVSADTKTSLAVRGG